MGQLAKQFVKFSSGPFLANTQMNPKKHCQSITTRSGKVIGVGVGEDLKVEEEVIERKEKEGEKKESDKIEKETEKGVENKESYVNKEKEKIEQKKKIEGGRGIEGKN